MSKVIRISESTLLRIKEFSQPDETPRQTLERLVKDRFEDHCNGVIPMKLHRDGEITWGGT